MIEWQIAYRGQGGELIEFGKMWALARAHGLISADQSQSIRRVILTLDKFFDESFAIMTESSHQRFYQFHVLWEKYPVLQRYLEADRIYIELTIRRRQRALGYQAMVFVNIPLSCCESIGVLGRPAHPREHVLWSPSTSTLENLVQSFAIASRVYQKDMLLLLDEVS